MTYPIVRAVAAPTPDAEVLFDFNDHGAWATAATAGAVKDGWSLGVPTPLAGVGDPRTAWGPRKCQFVIEIQGGRASALAAQSRLARWLLRPDGWVLFQLDALSRPVWLRMLGAQPQDLSFDRVFVDRDRDTWTLGCAFDADPFFYGERVEALTNTSVSQDPAGGLVVALPEVEGDAPSRLRLRLSDAGSGRRFELAGIPAPAADVEVWQVGTGDGFTGGSGGSIVSSPDSSGGSHRLTLFPGVDSMLTRFSGTAPSVPAPGLYRVLVRGFWSSSVPAVTSLSIDGASSEVVTWDDGLSVIQWRDYGVFQLPRGSVCLPGEAVMASAPVVDFKASMVGATTGQGIGVDAIVLIPVSPLEDYAESSQMSHVVGGTGDAAGLLVDGDFEVTRSLDGAGNLVSAATSGAKTWGGWPEVVPGRSNSLLVLGAWSEIGATVEVTASYMPRWLYLPSEVE